MTEVRDPRITTILGIPFLDAGVHEAITRLQSGGLMVVPSGPGLATLDTDEMYRDALVGADFAIVDSFFLAMLWFLATGHRVHRVSGLTFLRAFFSQANGRNEGALFLVNPTDEDGEANLKYLKARGFAVESKSCYTAPNYTRQTLHDERLLARLDAARPDYVMLNIGGGTQEPLGLFLKQNLRYRPAIICTGAAIAFLTGRQTPIPEWVDHTGLGWLARSVRNPRVFVPRYTRAFKLAALVARYRTRLPELRDEAA
jgi:N-acetylglucosaminyldiphosphoundecaprenol N-acetyl-beta-D-mannosaminyltransferase